MTLFKSLKTCVRSRSFKGLLLIGIVVGCSSEKGAFYIADVSKKHYFTDSASFHPWCCVATTVTGTLDAPGLIVIQGYLIGGFIDSIYLPKGAINIKSRGDFYVYRKIAIEYFPGEAKKGNLTIKTSIY